MNNVTLSGRTTKEIETKTLDSGKKLANFTLAVDRRTKEGKTADFIDCVAWGKTAEVLETYVRKGNMVGVVGSIQTRSYEDREGNKRKAVEVLVDKIELMGGNQGTSGEQVGNKWGTTGDTAPQYVMPEPKREEFPTGPLPFEL